MRFYPELKLKIPSKEKLRNFYLTKQFFRLCLDYHVYSTDLAAEKFIKLYLRYQMT